MATIRVLPADVVNQIAAGEVLERPSFLVKELVENSLDAGASEIEIDFANGGRNLLVRDNGRGMSREDLPLALHPHATSKISSGEDIYHLSTFGFRGEALASAAAVSEMRITSRVAGAPEGFRVEAQFGRVGDPFAISSEFGTTVEVEKLFENVPARLKFLKSDAAEAGQIKNVVKALALANPHVSFRLKQEGELKYFWPKSEDPLPRAQDILGVKPLFYGHLEADSLRVEVWVSSPLQTAQTSRNIWFFAQNRFIQDRSLMAAVSEAYRNLLMHGEYAQAVVKVTCDPSEIDVNVHPTKSQVKFRDSQAVFRGVMHAVRSVLEKAPWLQEATGSRALGGSFAPRASNSPAISLELSSPPLEAPTLRFQEPQLERIQYPQKSFNLREVREAHAALPRELAGTTGADSGAPATATVGFHWAQLQVIGQLHLTYIVAQSSDYFYLIDQHAAHERVMFERIMDQFQKGRFDIQNFLLPLVVDLTAHEVETLLRAREQIEKMGILFEQMGPDCIAVQGAPTFVSEGGVIEAIKKFALELTENAGSLAIEKKIADVAASMACHSVIRAGQALSEEQMKEILLQMDEFPLSSFCPHGRPVFVRRAFTDVEREFGRIV